MKRNMLRRFIATAAVLLAAVIWSANDVLAQDYGVGETVVVPPKAGMITIDGVYEADTWDTGATLDLLAANAFWSEDYPADVTSAEARVLFEQDTLYVFVTIEETELYFHDEGYAGDHILIGIDPVHEAGTTDQLVDQDEWAGWPENAPDAGPYALTVQGGANSGIKLWWGFADADPVAEGWVDGVVWEDPDNAQWGVEAAIYVPTVEAGAEIGFNIGGGTASQASADALGEEAVYGYFSQWSTENPGGDIQSLTSSYGTLRMAGGDSEGYGGGLTLQVPRVDPGAITIDGAADEAAWADAQSDINATLQWSSYGTVGDDLSGPDLQPETKLLWSEDTLYVFHRLFDPTLYFLEDVWNSDNIYIGIDNSHEGDSLFTENYDGAPQNAPEGVYTYYINDLIGVTLNGSDSIVVAEDLVNAVVYADESLGEWGLEAAFYVPAVEMDAQIGFDIGGTQASEDQCPDGECVYAYFAWQSGKEGSGEDPGAINRSALSWATLTMVEEITVAVEPIDEIPERFALKQNYPNPFNPTTTIEFATTQSGHVQIDVFNLIGRKVTTLVDENKAVGTYRVGFDAHGLTSGMYVYQLRVDGRLVDSKKMMLIK